MSQSLFTEDLPEQLENTWVAAQAIVENTLSVPTPFVTLVRNCWCGLADSVEFLRLSGFTKSSPLCLIDAAGIAKQGTKIDCNVMQQAVHVLGIRNAALVLAINGSVRAILKNQPGSWWFEMLERLALDLCVGYKLGSRVPELGPEGGMLAAFANYIGLGILSVSNKAAFRNYHRESSKGVVSPEREIELFGCEQYQVAACAIQVLGFGAEVAFGTALALGKLDYTGSNIEQLVKRWPAAVAWIAALRDGRSYPASLDHRNFFKTIAPTLDKQHRNTILEVLYTEVAKARQESKVLTWHLPKPSYEETRSHFYLA